MSDRARRKEKQRIKREKKKAAMRKSQGISPYARLGAAGVVEACYISADWDKNGIAQIHVLRRDQRAGYAMASFLVDFWCAGLKDAFGRLNLTRDDVDNFLDEAQERVGLIRIDLDTAKSMVAGSIRFANQNGFRLPAHLDRWTALLGGVGDVNSASLDGFGKDGGLLWVGPMDDLRKRLIGCTIDEFLARHDVHFVAGVGDFDFPDFEAEEDAWDDDEPDDEESDEAFDTLVEKCKKTIEAQAEAIYETASQHLRERSQEPVPALRDAARLRLAAEFLILDSSQSSTSSHQENIARGGEDTHDAPPEWDEIVNIAASGIIHDIAGELLPKEIPPHLKTAMEQLNPAIEELLECGELERAVKKKVKSLLKS